jgi:PKD repeat protein
MRNTDSFPLPPSTETFPLSHAYAAAGTYTVTVTITDDDGGVDTLTFIVTVSQAGYWNFLPVINK